MICLKKLSMYDGLTNIRNRRFFLMKLLKNIQWNKRDKKIFSCFDDRYRFFKPYNDNYGHGQGDETLRKVAKALEKT